MSSAACAAGAWAAEAPAAASPSPPPLEIAAAVDLEMPAVTTLAALQEALRRPVRSAQVQEAMPAGGSVVPLGRHGSADSSSLWLRFDARAATPAQAWYLEVPLVRLERATLYWLDEDGQPVHESAGTALPIADWPVNDRFAVFRLAPSHHQHAPRPYLLALHNSTPFSVAPQVVDDLKLLQRRQVDALLIGAFIGLALLALAYSAAQAITRRDTMYGWFTVHVAAMLLMQTVLTGVLRQSPVGQWPALMEALRLLSPIALVISAIFLIGHSLSRAVLGRLAWRLAQGTVAVGLLLALAIWWLPNAAGWTLYNLYLLASLSIAGVMLWRTRGRGLADVRWFALAFAALAVAAAAPLLSNFELLPRGLWTGRVLLCGAAVELALLMYALSRGASEADASRATLIRTLPRDQVTGFLAPQTIEGQVNTLLVNHRRSGQCGALILMQITNSRELVYEYGSHVNSLVLQAAARCVRQVIRTPDVPMRAGEMRLALLLRRTASRHEVLGVVERIIETGLRHSPELPAGERLRIVAAVAYLPDDVQRSTRSLIRELNQLLDRQREGSGLRVRELTREPGDTATLLRGAGLGGNTASGVDLELPPPARPAPTEVPAIAEAMPPTIAAAPADSPSATARETMAMLSRLVAQRDPQPPGP